MNTNIPDPFAVSIPSRSGVSRRAVLVVPLFLAPMACDEHKAEEGVSFREGEFNPIPAGTVCRGCVWAAPDPNDNSKLQLCVKRTAKYIGAERTPDDDVRVASLLKGGATWQASTSTWIEGSWDDENKTWTPASWTGYAWKGCGIEEGKPCSATEIATPPSSEARFELTVYNHVYGADGEAGTDDDLKEIDITLTKIGEKSFVGTPEVIPTIKVPLQEGPLNCDTDLILPSAQEPLPTPLSPFEPQDFPLPYMAHIAYPSKSGGLRACSGTLISKNQVLTAAHCFWEKPSRLSDVTVVIGTQDPFTSEAPPLSVSQIKVHVSYDFNMEGRVEHDLALVTLSENVDITTFFDLGVPKNVYCEVRAYGFGGTWHEWDAPLSYDTGHLKMRRLYKPSDDSNLATIEGMLAFTGAQFKELCRGDSGGPVFAFCGDNETYLVGVVSARVPTPPDDPEAQTFTPHNLGPPMRAAEILVDPLHAALAFSEGNDCGPRPADGFVAAYVDLAAITKDRMAKTLGSMLVKK